MTDYTKFYAALSTKPESEWVGILAVALKNCTKDPANAVKEAIAELEDDLAMERGCYEQAMSNLPRVGVERIEVMEE